MKCLPQKTSSDSVNAPSRVQLLYAIPCSPNFLRVLMFAISAVFPPIRKNRFSKKNLHRNNKILVYEFENMYFYCTFSIKTKILAMLGTWYFLKIAKINSQQEKPICPNRKN